MKNKILVTGGCGFIASNFIRLLTSQGFSPVILDKMTYAADISRFKGIDDDTCVKGLCVGDICDEKLCNDIIEKNDIDTIVNFAAESHVDRSILDSKPFIITNIEGTHNILEMCRKYDIKKMVHISTDEVYGELGETGKFVETLPLLPNSPYSAAKASADLIIRAYYETYGLPVTIVRPSNNYGYYQFPEKFIPLAITNLLEDKSVPVYGEGKNIRDWAFVEDCCKGIESVMNRGKNGEIYNLGGENEKRNIDIVRMILKLLNKDESCIQFVKDRPGHDYRYALDNTKIRREINWKPKVCIEEGLAKTVEWYKNNISWWKPLKERLTRESKGFWS